VLVVIAAVADNGVIGASGAMPWHLADDLRRFKGLTTGHPLVMGRKTFESIGRALPGRHTIVVTRTPGWTAEGVTVVGSCDDGLAVAADLAGDGPVFVAGGGEIYAQVLDRADRLEITHVHHEAEGDTVFPPIDPSRWRRAAATAGKGCTFATYERVAAPVRDLAELLATMRPRRHDGEYVFCCVRPGDARILARPVVVVHEDEGKTLVLEAGAASSAGFDVADRFAWITLDVHSDLSAVGLTAAVSGALAARGIACNVVAGFHHDHLFVPADRADEALVVLAALAATA
jgi:dihydrofolate reductase